jgi:phage terminase Nu1 subunit (DNA packaging protein)
LVEPEGTLAPSDVSAANAAIKGGISLAAPEFVLSPQPAPPMGAMAEASLRKEQAEARLKELRLEEEEGRLIDVEAVGQELSRLVRECRDGMLGMASRLAPRVASISDERQVHLLMTEEIEQCLHKVASELEQYAEAA